MKLEINSECKINIIIRVKIITVIILSHSIKELLVENTSS